MVSNDFKGRCEAATRFIESCFDENNQGDGLTFDERINQRKNELPADVRSIVDDAQHYDDVATPENIEDDDLEEICECDCGHVSHKDLLTLASEAKGAYRDKYRELKEEKARLKLETDWTEVIEGKSKPSETDKKDWILLETLPLQEELDDLQTEAEYLWERWELEKIMLRKQ